jgi:hypothetical protein
VAGPAHSVGPWLNEIFIWQNQQAETSPEDGPEIYDPFPGLKIMKQYCTQDFKANKSPDPKLCILEIVKIQLKVTDPNPLGSH